MDTGELVLAGGVLLVGGVIVWKLTQPAGGSLASGVPSATRPPSSSAYDTVEGIVAKGGYAALVSSGVPAPAASFIAQNNFVSNAKRLWSVASSSTVKNAASTVLRGAETVAQAPLKAATSVVHTLTFGLL